MAPASRAAAILAATPGPGGRRGRCSPARDHLPRRRGRGFHPPWDPSTLDSWAGGGWLGGVSVQGKGHVSLPPTQGSSPPTQPRRQPGAGRGRAQVSRVPFRWLLTGGKGRRPRPFARCRQKELRACVLSKRLSWRRGLGVHWHLFLGAPLPRPLLVPPRRPGLPGSGFCTHCISLPPRPAHRPPACRASPPSGLGRLHLQETWPPSLPAGPAPTVRVSRITRRGPAERGCVAAWLRGRETSLRPACRFSVSAGAPVCPLPPTGLTSVRRGGRCSTPTPWGVLHAS